MAYVLTARPRPTLPPAMVAVKILRNYPPHVDPCISHFYYFSILPPSLTNGQFCCEFRDLHRNLLGNSLSIRLMFLVEHRSFKARIFTCSLTQENRPLGSSYLSPLRQPSFRLTGRSAKNSLAENSSVTSTGRLVVEPVQSAKSKTSIRIIPAGLAPLPSRMVRDNPISIILASRYQSPQ